MFVKTNAFSSWRRNVPIVYRYFPIIFNPKPVFVCLFVSDPYLILAIIRSCCVVHFFRIGIIPSVTAFFFLHQWKKVSTAAERNLMSHVGGDPPSDRFYLVSPVRVV